MMGYDAWSDGLSADNYLEQCLSSPKYSQGTWYVLEDGAGLVSSLIVYRAGFELPAGCWGIGSVATPPEQRRKGYAASLIQYVVELAGKEEVRGIYLFSGIGPEYYAGLGFELVPVAPNNLPGACMVLCFRDSDELQGITPAFF